MIKKIGVLLVLSLFFISTAALAQGGSSTTTREQKAADREENREAFKTEKRGAAEERIKAHVDAMIDRFTKAIEWLEKVTQRIESRIAKLKGEGADTSVSEKHVTDAKAQIVKAKEAIAKLPAAVDEALENTTLRGAFAEVRTLVKDARDAIKSAHNLLVQAIRNLKPGFNRATSTTP
jgi:Mg2+ and Co2+ transporter CorA